MKAKFNWNGQVIEQELRAMSEPPNNGCDVIVVLDGICLTYTYRQLLINSGWYSGDDLDPVAINYFGWCPMPELVEVEG